VHLVASWTMVGSWSPGLRRPDSMSARRSAAIDSYGSRGGGGSAFGIKAAMTVAAFRSASSTQAAYTFNVVAPPLPSPRRPATVRMSTPAAIGSVAE
jgi:hypothetical protein